MRLLHDASSSSYSGAAACISLIILATWLTRFTVADVTATEAAYNCKEGCHVAFAPVCGADGQTYANACVAICQEVLVTRTGPCDGETLFHPDNKYVMAGGAQGDTSAAAANLPWLLTRHHLDAFRHEGFRYAGRMHFTNEMPQKHPSKQQQQQAAAATAEVAQGPSWGLGSDVGQQPVTPGSRATRVTREGHVYLADLDENVDTVLDHLIQRHKEEEEAATAAAKAAEGWGDQQQQQQEQVAHSVLHSLKHWRNYRDRRSGGGKRGGGRGRLGDEESDGGGSKRIRHTIITATRGPMDHVVQPELDVTGRVSSVGFVAHGSTSTAAATDTGVHGGGCDGSRQHQQLRQGMQEGAEEVEESEGLNGKQVLGVSKRGWSSARSEGGGWGGSEVHHHHHPVRRSLGIFDVDERIDCPHTPTYPFTAMGQINVLDPSGNYVCSGVLVGPDVVLTAAHCVFNRRLQAFYEQLDFAPSRYRTVDGQVLNPFGIAYWSYVTTYQGYQSLTTPDPNIQDIAVIVLKERVGMLTGWMGVFEPCSPNAPSRYVALTAGYPSDQPGGSCKTTQCVVMQDPCTDGYLYHKCDTASGQSGSPMYMMAMMARKSLGPYVRAVHNIEWVQEEPNGSLISYINSAVSLTPDHYRSLLAWIGPSFASNKTSNGSVPMGPSLPPNDYLVQIGASR